MQLNTVTFNDRFGRFLIVVYPAKLANEAVLDPVYGFR